ncbi:hypothetical protein ABH309_21010, partial [Chromobacterium piscinae]
GAAVARRYWEETAADLDALRESEPDAISRLRRYPEIFRRSLERDNRICMASFMAAEYDDLPDQVKEEVKIFAEVNIAWLAAQLEEAGIASDEERNSRAQAIYAA